MESAGNSPFLRIEDPDLLGCGSSLFKRSDPDLISTPIFGSELTVGYREDVKTFFWKTKAKARNLDLNKAFDLRG